MPLRYTGEQKRGKSVQREIRTKLLSDHERLFVSLADGINNTLLQMALLSEREAGQGPKKRERKDAWQTINDISRASLQLLEGYTLTMRLQGGSAEPELEPVALSRLLYETKQLLEPYAKQLSIRLEVDLPNRLEPVVSDPAILRSALVSLGQVFIAAGAQTENEAAVIRLGAHRSRYGIVTGWYSQGLQLTSSSLRRARRLGGWAQQPFGELVNGPASGVFIADNLLGAVSGHLHVARYRNASGLAVTLPVCQQLQLM